MRKSGGGRASTHTIFSVPAMRVRIVRGPDVFHLQHIAAFGAAFNGAVSGQLVATEGDGLVLGEDLGDWVRGEPGIRGQGRFRGKWERGRGGSVRSTRS